MTTVETINDDLQSLANRLKKDFPGWCITWGYIGNIWHQPTYCDDRSWRISMRPEGIMECWESRDCYPIGHKNDPEDKSLVFLFDEEHFFNWVEKQKAHWNNYMLVNYVNRMKGKNEKEVLLNMLERFGYYGKNIYYSDETLHFTFKRKNQYGSDDKYTYAKIEFAFDTKGNLVDVRAAS